MEVKTIHCPRCGKTVAGAFCSHCGAPLGGGTAGLWNTPIIVSWIAVSVATVALVFSLLAWYEPGSKSVEPELPPFTSTLPPSAVAPGQPPDLTSMSPREAADRLFNRVMTASESGDTQQALQFAPMALQAYERAGAQDNDARYHVALIHLVEGDTNGARTEINRIRKSAPGHLLAFMLEHQIAVRQGNQANVARANKGFLAAYNAEIAITRGEYQDHRSSIERFRQAAQAGVAGKP